MIKFDSADDELRDDEYPGETDWDDAGDEDEVDTVECSACGAEVYEDSVQCPICGEFLSANTSPLAGRSMWFVVLGVVGVLATLWALVVLC